MQSLEGDVRTFFKGPVTMAIAVGRTDPCGKLQHTPLSLPWEHFVAPQMPSNVTVFFLKEGKKNKHKPTVSDTVCACETLFNI